MARFLVVLDVDSTLIENEVIELLAEQAGSLAAVAEITDQAMNGRLDFESSLKARVATLHGLTEADVATAVSRITLTEGVRELIDAVHAEGGSVGVVSGGFHEAIDDLAEELGLDYWHANRLESRDGALTGELRGPIVDAAEKAQTLRRWAADCGLDLAHTIAVGDGANDLEMMSICGLAVGFDAKAPVRDAAHVLIDTRDLSQLLPLLGLRG
ncbi:MAG TPA: phosphoserine phosphatase SerB [Terrimesophilobacter sp.]|nr:phosphoserine phosphatase SerB [Terrimesophilobacter sp.]